MAELYLAQDTRDGVSVCVKRILPYLAAEQEFSSMFLDEARIASTLHHPNIVAVRDLGNTGDNIYIVMEFVDGLDLRRVGQEEQKKKAQMPYALAAWIVARVAEGLGYAHDICWPRGHPRAGKRIGLIHRDVSPQNVMLSYDGEVKLVDFGIAKASEEMDKTKPGIIKGKFLYLAPEQVGGDKLDHRADLFALGTLLYEVTTGKSPFQRATAEGVIVAIRSEEPEEPKKVRRDFPSELAKIIRKCLQKDREKRYQSGAEVAADLDAWLDSQDEAGAPQVAAYLDKLLGGTKAKRVSLPPPPAVPVRPQQPSGRPGDQTVDHPPARPPAMPARRNAPPPRAAPPPQRVAPPVASLGDDDEPEATQMMAAFSGDSLAETGDHEPFEPTPPPAPRPRAAPEPRGKVVQGPWNHPPAPAPRRPARAGAIQLNPADNSSSEITAQEDDDSDLTDQDQTVTRGGGNRPAPGQGLKRALPQQRRGKGAALAVVGLVVLLAAGGAGGWWYLEQQRAQEAAAREPGPPEEPQPLPQAAAPAEPEKPPEPPPPPVPPPPVKVGLELQGPKGAEARLVSDGAEPTPLVLGEQASLPPGKVDYEFRCKGKGNWKVATVELSEPGPVQVTLPCPK